jgi:predicted transcriptional regulator
MDDPLIDILDTSNCEKLSTELKWYAVLDFVQQNPGSHLRRIKKELNISMGTVQYQLDRLEKASLFTPI